MNDETSLMNSGQGAVREHDAQMLLDAVVVELFQRATQPVAARSTTFGRMPIIVDPVLADQVFHDYEVFQKNFGLVAAIGESRFNINGQRWSEVRSRSQPFYSKMGRTSKRVDIEAIYVDELEKIDIGDPLSIESSFSRAALRVFFLAYGVAPDVSPFMEHVAKLRAFSALLQFASWVPNQDVEGLVEQALNVAEEFAELCLQDNNLAELLTNWVPREKKPEFQSLISDFMTNMFAGTETTTATLCWATEHLGKSPPAQERIAEEVSSGSSTMPYLHCFALETLRNFPPIPFVIREVTRQVNLGDRFLNPKDLVLISIVELHRHPEYWEQPNVFDTSHSAFLNKEYDHRAFCPFLTGPRVCGGRRLAEMEILGGLRQFVKRYRVETPGKATAMTYSLALRPILSSSMKISRRNQ